MTWGTPQNLICTERTDTMKWITDILKKMDKTKWMILGLSGILLLVAALPAGRTSRTDDNATFEQGQQDAMQQENEVKAYKKQLTSELEQALSSMDGVGKAHVMITFQDSGEAVVEKDITKSSNGSGSSQYQEATIYQETDGRQPYVSQQRFPSVEGVLVSAQGGGDSTVKQNILDAVMALFGVEAHKIKIVKMQDK